MSEVPERTHLNADESRRTSSSAGDASTGDGPAIAALDVFFSYTGLDPVLAGLSLKVPQGAFLGIVGPNGAGKSTLLHLMTGALQPDRGRMLLMGRPVSQWNRRRAAREVAVVPQSEALFYAYRVRELVLMGRTPWLEGFWSAETADDLAIADRALEAAGIPHLADRPLDRVSGGERQMALVARALAQNTGVLLLDEPTASLDLAHQQQLMRLLVKLNGERHLTVVVVTHDLNLAALYCRTLAVLSEGRIVAEGEPAAIMRSELLGPVYRAGLWAAASPAGAPMVGLER